MGLLRNVCLLPVEFLAKRVSTTLEKYPRTWISHTNALLADSRKTGEDEVNITFLINFLNANLPKRKIKFFHFILDSFANSLKKMGRHVHIMVKYDSFFPICDFCTAQHFLLTCMKLNRSVFYFILKVLLPLPSA